MSEGSEFLKREYKTLLRIISEGWVSLEELNTIHLSKGVMEILIKHGYSAQHSGATDQRVRRVVLGKFGIWESLRSEND